MRKIFTVLILSLFTSSLSLGQTYSATDSVIVTSTNTSITGWGRGFEFIPNVDIYVSHMGKRSLDPQGTFVWKIWETTTQNLVYTQTSMVTSSGSYVYEATDSIVKLSAGKNYILTLYSDQSGYYYGSSSQVNSNLTYVQMVYCNSCFATMPFPTLTLSNMHYGTPDFLFSKCAPIDTSVSISGNTLTANNSSATWYQWIDCDNNNAAITGETGQSFTPSTNGNYAVVVTENSCSDTSACFNMTPVGISTNTANNELVLYPNPTKGQLTIEIEKNNVVAYSISSIDGKTIMEGNVSKKATKLKIDLSNESEGIYLLKIIKENSFEVYKIHKQ